MADNMKYFCIIKITLLILSLISGIASTSACFSYEEINKQLNLVKGTTYLLNFDDKVTKYYLENKEAANIEFVHSIYRNNQDMLIKTLNDTETKLFVWTKDSSYKFNVIILPAKSVNMSIVTEANEPVNDETLDVPPSKQVFDTKMFGFEIDSPPGKRK